MAAFFAHHYCLSLSPFPFTLYFAWSHSLCHPYQACCAMHQSQAVNACLPAHINRNA